MTDMTDYRMGFADAINSVQELLNAEILHYHHWDDAQYVLTKFNSLIEQIFKSVVIESKDARA